MSFLRAPIYKPQPSLNKVLNPPEAQKHRTLSTGSPLFYFERRCPEAQSQAGAVLYHRPTVCQHVEKLALLDPVSLSFVVSVCLSICLPISLSLSLSLFLSLSLSLSLSPSLSLSLSRSRSLCLSIMYLREYVSALMSRAYCRYVSMHTYVYVCVQCNAMRRSGLI